MKVNRSRCAILFSLAMMIAVPLHADQVSPPRPRLDAVAAADQALGRLEIVRAEELWNEELRIAAEYAGQWRNPSVEFGAGRRHSAGSLFEDGGSGPAFSVTVSQPLYFPGKSARREELIEAQRRLAALSIEEKKLVIRYRIIRLAYEHASAERLHELAGRRVRRFRLMERFLAGRRAVSPARRTERDIVRRRLRILERGLHEIEVGRNVLRRRLALYTGDDLDVTVRWPLRGIVLERDVLMQRALQQSPRYLKERARSAELAAELRLAEREAYPDMEVFATLENAPAEQYVGAGLRFAIPLFDRNQSTTRRLEVRRDAAQLRTQFAERELRELLEIACIEFEHSLEALQTFPLTLENITLKEMDAVDLGFRRGRVDLLPYLEADEQAFETLRAVYAVRLDYIHNYTELLMLSGDSRFIYEEAAE